METGWITPHGTFIPCKPGEHARTAREMYCSVQENDVDRLVEYWVKITISYDNLPLIAFRKPTQAQRTAVWDWCIRNGRTDDYPFREEDKNA